jgi:flagellar basal-body rod protein FlgG
MIRALNTAATGMLAQQANMDVTANNMANVSTAGFKRSRAEFEDLLYQTQREPGSAAGLNSISPTGVQIGMGVKTSAVQKDMTVGSPVMTKRPLDIMIEGGGFFSVQSTDGAVSYTRDGQFQLDTQGRIVDKNGNTLQPEISIPPNISLIEVTPQGEVRVSSNATEVPRAIGQIELYNFVNPVGLRSMGKNLYSQTSASGQAIGTRPGLQGTGYLAQGEFETSNVNIVDEMVNMITAQRSYESNSKAIQAADQMLQTINTLR